MTTQLNTTALRPGDTGYAEGGAAWNRNAQQAPAAVVMAESAQNVLDALRLARTEGRGVGVMATGHGTATPCDNGVLVNTSRMRAIAVDPVARTARVAAGARWADVIPRAAAHGLAGLQGSSSHVGVVGFTMGGGFGWLGRRYGLASGSVRSAEVVTADGELVTAAADDNPDLFWGLGGGGGNFGIVTSLEFALHPVAHVYAGNLYYPVDRARDVLEFWAGWTAALPDEMTSAVAFRRFPPLPTIPAAFRGRLFVALRGCWCGEDLAEGAQLVDAARRALGAPEIDTWAAMPAAGLDAVSMDPVDPLAALSHSELLRDLSAAAIDTLVDMGSDSPLIMLELRQLGGALARSSTMLSPMAHSAAPFSLNAIGVTPTPQSVRAIRGYLAHVADAMRPHVTGETYLNFMDLGGATPQRVRAAYSADDWARLVDLKGRYDADNVFRFNRNIQPP
jgi:FAD binding domain/Berberine and berberine like